MISLLALALIVCAYSLNHNTIQRNGARPLVEYSDGGIYAPPSITRRALGSGLAAAAGALVALPADASIDVNNAMAREFSAYPGLFPTVGTKLVKRGPFKSKKDMYAALDSDAERAALKKYDAAIVLNKRDSALMQYKGSQICKYECSRGKGGTYRDEQIREVQANRR
mmetsp:Transcript_28673/g.85684  ORF Transcript_28673/g.85684 Transcript_28673/m.85684 type:complete len:168 (-) Transcript_28673:42-545(-)